MYKKPCLIVLFFFVLTIVNAQNVDINLLRDINLNRDRLLNPFFIFITNSVTPICIAAPVILFLWSLLKKEAILQKKSIYIGFSVIISLLLSALLKLSINRIRPFSAYSFIEKVTNVTSASFPSRHTSTAFVIATSLSIAFPKWYIIVFSFLWALAIGYSRIVLGVHYPSDVFAGAIVGSGSALITYKVNQYGSKRSKQTSHKN
ncbi:phosphatase PAP2 family protein [Flavobacterium sp. ZS1P14]|uniref:phosphatase PAP2 family protein n=1 Tax=Flavobacterium sp. ZS1P14 TaxID=3401729 RepID=UPI003AAD3F4D